MLFFFFAIASRGAMFEPATVARILDTAWPMGIVAITMGMLIVGGEFDLSVGVMLATALGVMSTVWGMHLGAALPLSLVLCLALGALNGVIVVGTGLPSFVVSLGMFFGLRGADVAISRHYTGSAVIEGVDHTAGYDGAQALFATVMGTAPQISASP